MVELKFEQEGTVELPVLRFCLQAGLQTRIHCIARYQSRGWRLHTCPAVAIVAVSWSIQFNWRFIRRRGKISGLAGARIVCAVSTA